MKPRFIKTTHVNTCPKCKVSLKPIALQVCKTCYDDDFFERLKEERRQALRQVQMETLTSPDDSSEPKRYEVSYATRSGIRAVELYRTFDEANSRFASLEKLRIMGLLFEDTKAQKSARVIKRHDGTRRF